MAATAVSSTSSPFIRSLVSSSRESRRKALSSLRTYLTTNRTLSELDHLKLWKGLFYCMYMQDKPRQQQRLADELAELVECLPRTTAGSKEQVENEDNDHDDEEADEDRSDEPASISFIRAFWTTMAREWPGLDKYRTDKFLLLMRRYIAAGFNVLQREDWDPRLTRRYVKVLAQGPLSLRDVKVPVGIRLHVLDIFVDELERVDADHKAPVEVLLRPVRRLAKESLVKSVRARAKETLEDERIEGWEGFQSSVAKTTNETTNAITQANDPEPSAAAPAPGADDGEWGGFDD